MTYFLYVVQYHNISCFQSNCDTFLFHLSYKAPNLSYIQYNYLSYMSYMSYIIYLTCLTCLTRTCLTCLTCLTYNIIIIFRLSSRKDKKMCIKYKNVTCPECGRKITVKLRTGESEWKDGYHGECPGPHCGFWYFEEILSDEQKPCSLP